MSLTPLDRAPLAVDLPHRLAGSAPRVVVVGDAVLDCWMTGPSHRLSREAPVPVVEIDRTRCQPGGAANTAANLAALGARVALVSVVGDDDDGRTVRRLLAEAGVDTSGVLVATDRPTAAKRRIVADEAMVARYDTVPPVRPVGGFDRALDDALAGEPDATVVCDYAAGALDDDAVAALVGRRDRLGVLVVDAHDVARWQPARPDVVTPNAGEVATLLGRPLPAPDRVAAAEAAAPELRERSGASTVVVTLDRDGAVLLAPDQPAHRTWARPAPESRTCGAGDSFTAGLALALAAGTPAATAAELAQAAADVVVARAHTAVCSTSDLAARVSASGEALSTPDELARLVAGHRAEGRRIVFTNGCFDVVHRGHVAYLNQAKRLGDVLVVALNADESVGRLKGPERPVNPLADRAAVIGALSCVDHVVGFAEDTPVALLEELRPDVYAKGGDYTPDMLPETPTVSAYGGQVAILDYLPDRSTSLIVEKIRARG
ncbi:D-glycero-beta-D-manno-heptose 1-phosphate adenylyltransferase [Actinomycetospora termitidis]|uniref:Bifunctional protein HldE n=1 Tax=Actinomycetospora termitidis TaxID=3053470 RepID=A0ABT7MIP2_9PSEU|nr:D-glycero-beta-D-manno-heptose 1-phosphate adenylyltransferase [Actinomycetospora sp. Odt1-22]MDL5160553.1 D-glycero-beta-D-manno-heptose 1-phosphate adenylyltransferase [Actinomycetospora sp. Odt1-22]